MTTIWIILMLLGIIGWLIYLFNTLVGLSNHTDAAWADIDAQLKRRYELVGKLIELANANGVAGTEQLTAARATAAEAYTPAEKSRSEPPLVAATQTVLSTASGNSQLDGNPELAELQHTLHDIEDYLRDARREYNDLVQHLNAQTEAFPNNYAASLFGVEAREMFQIDGHQPASS